MHERYNKKYRAVSVKATDNREVHDNIRGKICYPYREGKEIICQVENLLRR